MKKSLVFIVLFSFFGGIAISQTEDPYEIPEIEIIYKALSWSVFYDATEEFSDIKKTNHYFKFWIDPKKKTISYFEKNKRGKKILNKKYTIEAMHQDEVLYEFHTSEDGEKVKIAVWKNGEMLAVMKAGVNYIYSDK